MRRGHQVYDQHSEPKLRGFAIRIAEHFEFRPDWYRQGSVAALVLEYYFVLRSVLRAKPDLRACLTRCRHCRIFFLTHPCNLRQLGQIRCPFGCRTEHRRREAIGRSTTYYGDEEGKKIKQKLNQRRCRLSDRPPGKGLAASPKAKRPARPKRAAGKILKARNSL